MFFAYLTFALALQFIFDQPVEPMRNTNNSAVQESQISKLTFERNCSACHLVAMNAIGPKL